VANAKAAWLKSFAIYDIFVFKLLLPFSSVTSILGFMLLLYTVTQLLSGFFLGGWHYIPEPGLAIGLREEMFNNTRFGSEVFYTRVSGVDTLMLLSYLRTLKKILLKNYSTSDSDGWLSGGSRLLILSLYYLSRYILKCLSLKRPDLDHGRKYLLVFDR
jgi:hypothetical protein